jgi:hypothetical protein
VGNTRSEVEAEFAQARLRGDILAAGRSDLTLREAFPQQYSQQ